MQQKNLVPLVQQLQCLLQSFKRALVLSVIECECLDFKAASSSLLAPFCWEGTITNGRYAKQVLAPEHLQAHMKAQEVGEINRGKRKIKSMFCAQKSEFTLAFCLIYLAPSAMGPHSMTGNLLCLISSPLLWKLFSGCLLAWKGKTDCIGIISLCCFNWKYPFPFCMGLNIVTEPGYITNPIQLLHALCYEGSPPHHSTMKGTVTRSSTKLGHRENEANI